MPNSNKNFMWRACHNILPTRENLLRRKIITDSRCPICGIEVETANHILWSCPLASDVWSARERFFHKNNYLDGDFLQLVEKIYEKGGREMLNVFARQAKGIWMRRNGVIHGEVLTDPNELARITTQALNDFHQANQAEAHIILQERITPNELWVKPTEGCDKINWDVGMDRSMDRFGM